MLVPFVKRIYGMVDCGVGRNSYFFFFFCCCFVLVTGCWQHRKRAKQYWLSLAKAAYQAISSIQAHIRTHFFSLLIFFLSFFCILFVLLFFLFALFSFFHSIFYVVSRVSILCIYSEKSKMHHQKRRNKAPSEKKNLFVSIEIVVQRPKCIFGWNIRPIHC